MLQAQPSTLPTLTKGQNSALKNLTIMGYLEGTSFLLLLGIAMPLKYMMDIPEAVKYVGMAHGALFIAYILVLLIATSKIKMPLWAMPASYAYGFHRLGYGVLHPPARLNPRCR